MKKKDECVFYCKNDKYTLKKQGFCAKAPPVKYILTYNAVRTYVLVRNGELRQTKLLSLRWNCEAYSRNRTYNDN